MLVQVRRGGEAACRRPDLSQQPQQADSDRPGLPCPALLCLILIALPLAHAHDFAPWQWPGRRVSEREGWTWTAPCSPSRRAGRCSKSRWGGSGSSLPGR